MAATPPTNHTTAELWTVIKKEITGIQLLWAAVNGLYFQPQGKEWQALLTTTPLLVHLTQTAMMESLLMRVSRLMDPADKGKWTNLSLQHLVVADVSIDADEKALRTVWDGSGLVAIRNKYLSHNDRNRSLTEDHTLNIPLNSADIDALRQLVEGLRTLRRNVNPKLGVGAYVDQPLDLLVNREIEVLGKTLLGGKHFFELQPEHLVFQDDLAV